MRHVRLLDPKGAKPETFKGDRREIRGWMEWLMAYANSMTLGFRKALKWAAKQTVIIDKDKLLELSWPPVDEADVALYDILITITAGEPRTMVRNAPGEEAGFEAWRTIVQWYDSYNSNNQIEIINQLVSVQRCKRPQDVFVSLNTREHEWAESQERSNEQLPQSWRTALLLNI